MKNKNQELEALQDIRQMMERSSRFISLSGWSGISAGTCALIGAFFAYRVINNDMPLDGDIRFNSKIISLLIIAALTFIAALISAMFFTYRKSRQNNMPVWSVTSRRLMWSVAVPMVAGGIYLCKIIYLNIPGLVSPGCLIFYGIALFSGSKLTLNEIRYLSYAEIALGIICLFLPGYGLYFWAMGFGVFHIIYGIYMWWKYEKNGHK